MTFGVGLNGLPAFAVDLRLAVMGDGRPIQRIIAGYARPGTFLSENAT